MQQTVEIFFESYVIDTGKKATSAVSYAIN